MNFFKRFFRLGRHAEPAAPGGPGPVPLALVGPPEGDTPLVAVRTGEALTVMDRMAYEYQTGQARGTDPAQADLDDVFAGVERVRVLAGGMMRDRALGTEVLLDTRARAEIESLRAGLAVVEDPATFGHCACLGGPTVELFAGRGASPVATLALHHGRSLRWSRWRHDALLRAPDHLASWLARHALTCDDLPGGGDPPALALLGLADAERHARRAESHRRRGEPRAALDECDRALECDPASATALGVRALVHREAGRHAESETDCDAAIRLGLNHPEVFLARAVARDALGRPDQALADCDAAIRLAPDQAGAYNSRALVRKRLGRAVEALADFAHALELAPDWPLPPANRGMAHLEAGRFDRAAADFTEAIRRVGRLDLPDPAAWRGGPDISLASFHALRAQALEALGDLETAAADYDRAAEFGPDDPRVYLSRGLFRFKSGEPAAALDDFNEAVRLRPDLAAGYLERGRAVAALGDPEAALADFEEAVLWAPDEPAAYSFRARALTTLGRPADALRDLDRLVDLAPDSPLAVFQRAHCRAALGDQPRRRDDLERAVALAPDWPEACNGLAWFLATCPDPLLRDGPRAVGLARHAAELLPGPQPEVLDTLAAACAECGDFARALAHETQALELLDDPDRRLSFHARLQLYEAARPYREPAPDLEPQTGG